MPLVALIVPVPGKALSSDEEFAIRHLHRHLGHYDCYQLSPESFNFQIEGLKSIKLGDSYFRSTHTYSKLLLSSQFYRQFAEYKFILIYQLDCLVFRDELQWWCEQGYDYIGAPLFNLKGAPNSGFSGACNGGLSLRKVSSFLNVLESRRYLDEKVSFLADVFHRPFVEVRPLRWVKRCLKRMKVAQEVRQGVKKYAAAYSVNEDHFWSARASYFYPEFRIAPPENALSFAFESAPAWCFERNGRKLPFGAHAWTRYDRPFWEPSLINKQPASAFL